MSMNLYIKGCPHVRRQTSSEFTYWALGKDRYEVLAAYKRYYLDPYAPKPLEGKDARNPFLIQQHAEVVAEFNQEYEGLKAWLDAHPEARWEVR